MSSFFPLSPPAHSFFIGPTVINIYIYIHDCLPPPLITLSPAAFTFQNHPQGAEHKTAKRGKERSIENQPSCGCEYVLCWCVWVVCCVLVWYVLACVYVSIIIAEGKPHRNR
jgi:hypothetical protein